MRQVWAAGAQWALAQVNGDACTFFDRERERITREHSTATRAAEERRHSDDLKADEEHLLQLVGPETATDVNICGTIGLKPRPPDEVVRAGVCHLGKHASLTITISLEIHAWTVAECR